MFGNLSKANLLYMDYTENLQSQYKYFSEKGIDISKPGFYDDPIFLELERQNPSLLNNYASLIKQTIFDAEYLTRVEEKIIKLASVLYRELEKDGRQGACIDLSTVLSRMLDKEGIWNYVSKGSLTITFPAGSGLNKKFFWTIDSGEYTAAHAWITAPPFQIIDLAIKQQPYKYNEKSFLPDMILQKAVDDTELDLTDLVEPTILNYLKLKTRGNKDLMLINVGPNLKPFSEFFRPVTFTLNGVQLKYTPTGIAASDVPLEQISSLKLNGKFGIDIYNSIK
jgi:hypothetical protein